MSALVHYDAIVVGGGPAGSSAAARLVQGGAKVAVLDREEFPRTKLCAGWVTPEAMADLALEPADYPRRFITFEQIVAHIKGLSFKLNTPPSTPSAATSSTTFSSSAAGRRSIGATSGRSAGENGHYVVGEEFRCDYLVGAGGTRCPVYRELFRERNPAGEGGCRPPPTSTSSPSNGRIRAATSGSSTRGCRATRGTCRRRRAGSNCGIGGMAEKLKARGADIKTHWRHFTEVLSSKGFVVGADYAPRGYSYYLRGDVDVVRIDNAFITGDSAGLATRDLCEGIGPAIRSGQRAAETILTGVEYRLDDLSSFSSDHAAIRGLLEYMFIRRKTRPRPRAAVRPSAAES